MVTLQWGMVYFWWWWFICRSNIQPELKHYFSLTRGANERTEKVSGFILHQQPWVQRVWFLLANPVPKGDFSVSTVGPILSVRKHCSTGLLIAVIFFFFSFILYCFESRPTKAYYLGHFLGPGALLH